MRINCREIGAELAIRIALMEKDDRHTVVGALLQYLAQLQRIAQSHICIAISIASMKLHWKLLVSCVLESDMQQEIYQRLVCYAQLPLLMNLGARLFESSESLIFTPLENV